MANIFEFLSKDGNITPEKARKSRQMQFHDKTTYVWGLRYRWDPSLSMNPVRQFAHFMPPWSLLIWEEQNVNKGHHETFLPISYQGVDAYYRRSVLHEHVDRSHMSWWKYFKRNQGTKMFWSVLEILNLNQFSCKIFLLLKIHNTHNSLENIKIANKNNSMHGENKWRMLSDEKFILDK